MVRFQLENKYHEYIFLDIINEHYWLNCFSNSNSYKIEITNKIDTICQKLKDINIQKWDFQNFNKPMHWFPSYEWKLIIHTDDINVNCLGLDNFPSNWDKFIDILNYIGFK